MVVAGATSTSRHCCVVSSCGKDINHPVRIYVMLQSVYLIQNEYGENVKLWFGFKAAGFILHTSMYCVYTHEQFQWNKLMCSHIQMESKSQYIDYKIFTILLLLLSK